MTGGVLAFLEHPGEWRRLRADPALLDTAVEEIVGWTTPVIQFDRTATRDYTLRETTIRKGQAVCPFYPSANRDEDVFADPFAFRIDRVPNEHIGFGIGDMSAWARISPGSNCATPSCSFATDSSTANSRVPSNVCDRASSGESSMRRCTGGSREGAGRGRARAGKPASCGR